MQEPPEVSIQSFSVRPDDFLEITYIERRDQADRAGLIKTLVVEPGVLRKEDFEDVMDSLRDFVDAGLRHIRTGETSEADD